MSGDELNPAAVAQPVEDVQGDGRWMSQVGAVGVVIVGGNTEFWCPFYHEIDTRFVPQRGIGK